MSKESDPRRGSRGIHRESLPVRRRVSREQSKAQGSRGKTEAVSVPEILISAPTNAESDGTDEDDGIPFISVGIDLGTTYSGVAWALSTSPDDISIISTWDSDLPANSDNHKVPSVLTYDSRGEVSSWGYKLRPSREHISWFKLLLSTHATEKVIREQPDRIKDLQHFLAKYRKEPVDVAADYLGKLWKHASDDISRRVPALWENADLKITLTVPAIWDLSAQELTRKAAEMAGLLDRKSTTLRLIGEPEAAALSVFEEMSRQRWQRLKLDDAFVVCDAGGGTVDLISYTVEGLKPLKLGMCAEATGALCGAISIDAAFEAQVKTMMSENDYLGIKARPRRRMMNDWEFGIKRRFRIDSKQDEPWNVDIQGFPGVEVGRQTGNDQNGMSYIRDMNSTTSSIMSNSSIASFRSDPGTLVLRTGHLHAIFGKTCSNVKKLIRAQVDAVVNIEKKKPRAILLVGGFGESIYLRQDLERTFRGIEIQQPVKAWAAICRGAVMKNLGGETVLNYISRFNYGTPFVDIPEVRVQPPLNPELQGNHSSSNVAHKMDWFLKKGEDICEGNPVTHEFFYPIWNPDSLRRLQCNIVYSDTAEAEETVGPGVKLLCKLVMSFDPKTYDELPKKRTANGEEWRQLDFVLEMRISSGETCWTIEYKGTQASSASKTIGEEGTE